jgi:predicted O-methyltransferase YrrM
MSGPELEWLYQRAGEHKVIIEIGSAFGRSSHALLSGNFNSFRDDGKVYCVDPWPHFVKGTKDEFDYNKKDLDRRRQFFQRVGYFPNLNLIELPSAVVSVLGPVLAPGMVFIDGGTKQIDSDLLAWSTTSSVKILCGHDYSDEYPEVIEAVDRIIGKVEIVPDTTIWYGRAR